MYTLNVKQQCYSAVDVGFKSQCDTCVMCAFVYIIMMIIVFYFKHFILVHI